MDLGWLEKLAPTVATALGGPLAGVAVSVLGKALGIDGATQAQVTDALQSGNLTGEQIAKIKVAEIELKQHESDNGFKFAELDVRDRESARIMQVQTKSYTPSVLSWLIVVATLGLEGYIMFKGYPKEIPELIIGRILGNLDMAFGTVLAYWLGTSIGSRNKDTALMNAASK